MAKKIKLLHDVNFQNEEKVVKGSFVEVSDSTADVLIKNKFAVLTGTFSIDNLTKPHLNLKHL
jgi:hypothetical protein